MTRLRFDSLGLLSLSVINTFEAQPCFLEVHISFDPPSFAKLLLLFLLNPLEPAELDQLFPSEGLQSENDMNSTHGETAGCGFIDQLLLLSEPKYDISATFKFLEV